MKISGFGSPFQMQQTNKKLSKLFGQLSSGKRVNSAQDDPSALALSSKLESSINSLKTSSQSISYAQGALNTASGGLDSQLSNLQRARELALQASNGTLSDSDRANLQQEFSQTIDAVDTTASQTSFAGNNLLDGSFTSSVVTGESGSSTSLSVNSSSASSLGVDSLDISTQAGAEDALESIDSAIAQVSSQQASIGASQNRLEFTESANAVQRENLEAAKSVAVDADLSDTLSELNKTQVLLAAQLKSNQLKLSNTKDQYSLLMNSKTKTN